MPVQRCTAKRLSTDWGPLGSYHLSGKTWRVAAYAHSLVRKYAPCVQTDHSASHTGSRPLSFAATVIRIIAPRPSGLITGGFQACMLQHCPKGDS